ncbi:MAG: D-alanine--D-alanine ligase [Bacteroidetes bacterium]|nr:D-alanine--D-alanine ligase [Bacteroidota bacterium]
MRIGILFGGPSREREISFAGGRTVYDMLDKRLFEPVPLFMDSLGNLVRLDWPYMYKGTIRDFFPPAARCPQLSFPFQFYAEHLYAQHAGHWDAFLADVGTPLSWQALPQHIDFAFLALHGRGGEDGSIQGVLELLGIPYSGAGIAASALGMDKLRQKALMQAYGFPLPRHTVVSLRDTPDQWQQVVATEVGFPCVVKNPLQGSSIGVQVVQHPGELAAAIRQCSFRQQLAAGFWAGLQEAEKNRWLNELADIRYGLGLPLQVQAGDGIPQTIAMPDELRDWLDAHSTREIYLQAQDAAEQLIVEQFIPGTEFSVIVVETPGGQDLALPPTQIVKGSEVFDYRSKYLAGMSRKITPMDAPPQVLATLRQAAVRLKQALGCEVYARLDGILSADGTPYFNDPNTISGMLPSSFFFHQAAEVGLAPTPFVTYVIRASLQQRARQPHLAGKALPLLQQLDAAVRQQEAAAPRLRVAVILGGYSSERHISVESGRNIYEKLASSGKYAPFPVFVLHNSKLPAAVRTRLGIDGAFSLWQIPVNILLKDNADDIADKVVRYASGSREAEALQHIREEAAGLRAAVGALPPDAPRYLKPGDWSGYMDFAFIALHGRPGEDGQLQQLLEQSGIPYNGSPVHSSRLTIDKYTTTELLMAAGLRAAGHRLVHKTDWARDAAALFAQIETQFSYPFIAKPYDDGCSSAVKILRNRAQLAAYAELLFRSAEELPAQATGLLGIRPQEEIPCKDTFLVETLIAPREGYRLLEVTVGLLTHYEAGGSLRYEVFAPSETLSSGEVLSLEEKFLAGEGQNITPARFDSNPARQAEIDTAVRQQIEAGARLLGVEGYARIDAFVYIPPAGAPEVYFIEVNSLPGMTPATCIFHQCALSGYTPLGFIEQIIAFGQQRPAAVKA